MVAQSPEEHKRDGEPPAVDPQAPVVLVDGSSYLFRAFHALPPLATADGQPTGAVKGVIGMLRKLVAENPGSPVVVVFDAKGKTFRDDLYAEYKANRPPMPEDLRAQIEPTHEIIRCLGLPLLIEPGVEADDVIGTLAHAYAEQGRAVLVSTSDKDLAQLVNAHVTLVNTMSDTRLDPDGVQEKFGVPPERIVDLLALTGDKVDNIPGIDGVGPKTAAKWLGQYGDLDGVIAAADAVKGKAGERLREGLDGLALSRELATIRLDVPLPTPPEDLRPDGAGRGGARGLVHAARVQGLAEGAAGRRRGAVRGSSGRQGGRHLHLHRRSRCARRPHLPHREGGAFLFRPRDHEPELHAGRDRRLGAGRSVR
jgi:5'-3' exonuclease